MASVPAKPKIYHITHGKHLRSIIAEGYLYSDAHMIGRGGPLVPIGMSKIKERRLELPVRCHEGTCVGDYVPFYFCSRSVMLYVIHCRDSEELAYKGGQKPVVHLEADLMQAIAWADKDKRRWAFSLSNAGARYAEFRSNPKQLGEIGWDAVAATKWSAPEIKEPKQAEFLVFDRFPWKLVTRIGVINESIKAKVEAVLADAEHKPAVEVQSAWYY